MADRYWVGGTGTWGTSTTNWSATSGGPGGASVPTLSDNVFFNAASGAAGTVCTVSGSRSCASINFTGYVGTLQGSSTPRISFAGSLTLSSTMVVASGAAFPELRFSAPSSSGTQTITTAGKTIYRLSTQNTGTLALSDNLTCSDSITWSIGTLNIGTRTCTASSFNVNYNGTSPRALTFGSGGKIVLTGTSGTVWNAANSTSLTVSGTFFVQSTVTPSSITIDNGSVVPGFWSDVTSPSFGASGTSGFVFANSGTGLIRLTGYFNNINTTGYTGGVFGFGSTARIFGDLTLRASETLSNITNATVTFTANTGITRTFTPTTANLGFGFSKDGAGTLVLAGPVTTTLGMTLNAGTINFGTFAHRVLFFSSSNTISRTLVFGAGSRIDATQYNGIAWNTSTVTGFSYTGTFHFRAIGDFLGAYRLIVVGTDTSVWGESTALNVSNTGTSGWVFPTTNASIVAVGGNFNNIDLSAFTKVQNTSYSARAYGDVTFPPQGFASTTPQTGQFIFSKSSGTQTLSFPAFGGTFIAPIVKENASTLVVTNAITSVASLTLTGGTYDPNGNTLRFSNILTSGTVARTLLFGSGGAVLTGTGVVWDFSATTGLTIASSTLDILISSASSAQTFNGGGLTYRNISLDGAGTGNLTITGANTFARIFSSRSVAFSLILPSGNTTTFTGAGLSGNAVMSLLSSSTGTQATVSKASGTVSANLASVRDSNATGGATWIAGASSVDLGNNTGWQFPPKSVGFFLMF